MAYEMIYGFILTLVTVLSHVSTDVSLTLYLYILLRGENEFM